MGVRVAITDCDLGTVEAETELLHRELGDDVDVVAAQCRTEDDVIAVAADADALIVQWAPVSARVIAELDRCQVISRYGIGVDMIDLQAAQARGIEVLNVPDYCIEEVATHTVALLLACWRRLPGLDGQVRGGDWAAGSAMRGVKRLSRSTVGLVGYGRIAALVGEAFRTWGAEVIAYDPFVTDSSVDLVGLEELAHRSDLISLHCPLTDQTRGLIDDSFLRLVKPTAVLANTARGPLVVTDDLIVALQERRLAGAALDVFDIEPLPGDSPLRSAPNLLLGPHAAWASDSALPALKAGAAWNVVRHFHNR